MHRRIQHATIRADGWFMNLADWSVDPAQRIDRDRIGLRGESR
jgi:peptide/nickel transport system substrate-binding protein